MVSRPHRPAGKRAKSPTARPAGWRLAPWLLVLSLVLAQLLGMMHRITHASAGDDDRAAAALVAAPATDPTDAAGWLADLFAAHAANDAGCKLYDAHGQAAAPKLPLLSLPVAGICFVGQVFQSAPLSRTQAPFEARAPPLFR